MRIGPIANPAALFAPLCALALTALLSAACSQIPPPAPPARLYAIDQAGGAKSCIAASTQLIDGKNASVPMSVGNDGGWCGITLVRADGPYSAGLLTARPAHGRVYIHTVGSVTRIDYTPATGYSGTDSFAVKMVPGDAVANVSVTVAK